MFYQELDQLKQLLYEHRRYQELYADDPSPFKNTNQLGKEALDKIEAYLKSLPQTPVPIPPKDWQPPSLDDILTIVYERIAKDPGRHINDYLADLRAAKGAGCARSYVYILEEQGKVVVNPHTGICTLTEKVCVQGE